MLGKRICLFLDGVVDDAPATEPSQGRGALYRLYSSLSLETVSGYEQVPYYDPGEPPRGLRTLAGRLLQRRPAVLAHSLEQAYGFLMRNYRAGDEIFLFGRGRGALTVHALTAMIARFGLLRCDDRVSITELIQRLLNGRDTQSIQRLSLEARAGCLPRREQDRRLLIDSRRVPIKFVGVWDTIAGPRIDALEIPGVASEGSEFRCMRVSSLVEHGFQALAIDETRPLYRPALWCQFRHDGARRPVVSLDRFEQRWFPGTHDNIAGDYDADPLARRPVAWMQAKAICCGLAFNTDLKTGREGSLQGEVTALPSANRFQRIASLFSAPTRPRRIGPGAVKLGTGKALPVNETVDIGALVRWEDDKSYRPESLRAWKQRRGIDSFLAFRRTVYAETARRIPTLSGQVLTV